MYAGDAGPTATCYAGPWVEIEGNLVIRWRESGGFDLSFVPLNPGQGVTTGVRRLRDVWALQRALTELGLDRDRVVDVVSSPYVLHSLRVRVARQAARRVGLLPTPIGRALAVLVELLRQSARRLARRPPSRS